MRLIFFFFFFFFCKELFVYISIVIISIFTIYRSQTSCTIYLCINFWPHTIILWRCFLFFSIVKYLATYYRNFYRSNRNFFFNKVCINSFPITLNPYMNTESVHKHTHTHIYIYIYMCVCVCIYIYIYIYVKVYLTCHYCFLFFFSDFPCNYLPCLEMDGGFRMPETMSICRYIARQYGKWDLIQFWLTKISFISFIHSSTLLIISYIQQWLPYLRFNNSNCKIIIQWRERNLTLSETEI